MLATPEPAGRGLPHAALRSVLDTRATWHAQVGSVEPGRAQEYPNTRPRSGRDHTLNFLCIPALQAAGLLAFLVLSAQVWIAAEARVYPAWDGRHLQQAGAARTSLKANKAINYVDQVG